jgi:hypothetical protein
MELSDIRKSISEMTDDEVRAELLSIRTNRRISKRPPAVERKSTSKAEVSTTSLLNNIDASQAAMLLALFEKKKG